jgi:GT2 family glycosyltransferase
MITANASSDSLGLVSIIVVTFNNAKDIRACLDSLRAQTYGPVEIIVFDNASTDGTVDSIRSVYSEVELVESQVNIGFAAANNRAVSLAQGDFLAFLNPDATVEPDWLLPLLRVLQSDGTVGAITPSLVFADAPDTLNACGNKVHLSGITYCREYGKPATDGPPEEVGAISGAAFVMRKNLFLKIGGFEERFFLYFEDTDLSLRLRCTGLRCMAVPHSRVRHAYKAIFGSDKILFMERNRYLSLLSLMSKRILFMMLPSLLVAEVASWGYCVLRGRQAMTAKARAWSDVMHMWPWVRERRQRHASHFTNHAYVLGAFSPQLRVQYVGSRTGILAHGLGALAWVASAPMLVVGRCFAVKQHE